MAWRCRFLTARRSQHGRVIAEKGLSEELSGAPDTLIVLCTGMYETLETPFLRGGCEPDVDPVPSDDGVQTYGTGAFGTLWVAPHEYDTQWWGCLLYTSPSPRDRLLSRMPSSA